MIEIDLAINLLPIRLPQPRIRAMFFFQSIDIWVHLLLITAFMMSLSSNSQQPVCDFVGLPAFDLSAWCVFLSSLCLFIYCMLFHSLSFAVCRRSSAGRTWLQNCMPFKCPLVVWFSCQYARSSDCDSQTAKPLKHCLLIDTVNCVLLPGGQIGYSTIWKYP